MHLLNHIIVKINKLLLYVNYLLQPLFYCCVFLFDVFNDLFNTFGNFLFGLYNTLMLSRIQNLQRLHRKIINRELIDILCLKRSPALRTLERLIIWEYFLHADCAHVVAAWQDIWLVGFFLVKGIADLAVAYFENFLFHFGIFKIDCFKIEINYIITFMYSNKII